MTFELEYAVIAEAAVLDPRGNPNIIGFDIQWWTVPAFPATITPALCVALSSNEDEPSSLAEPLTVDTQFQVTGPGREVLFFSEARQAIAAPSPLQRSRRLKLIAQVPFTVAKTGDYVFHVHLTVLGEVNPVAARRWLHVYDDASAREMVGD